jgi:hypothetical protein
MVGRIMVDLFPYGPDCTHASSIALLAMRHTESLSLHLYRFVGFVRFLDLTLPETTSASLSTRNLEKNLFSS